MVRDLKIERLLALFLGDIVISDSVLRIWLFKLDMGLLKIISPLGRETSVTQTAKQHEILSGSGVFHGIG